MRKKISFLSLIAVISLAFFTGNASAQVGSLSIALDPATPSSSVIVANSADVEFAKFKFTATGEDIDITSIKLTASASSSVNLTNIKLFDGSTLLGWIIAFPFSNTVTFSNYSLIRVPANSSKILTVKASVTGSGVASLGIQNPNTDISAVGQTSAYTIYPTPSTPVFGNIMTISDGGAPTVALPDLTVFDVYDDNGKLSVKIGNIGSGAAPSGVGHLYIWIDDQLIWTYSLSTLYNQSFLTPGGVMIVQPQVVSGQHKIKATIDPNGAIVESNENNNTLEKTLSFSGSISIKLLSPNGGETMEIGSAQTIKWTPYGILSVVLHLTDSNGAVMATNLVNISGNPQQAVWTIPSHIPAGNYKIKIAGCNVTNICTIGDVSDMSDAPFSIVTGTTSSTIKPDLIISDFLWTPLNPTVSQTDPYIYFNFTVKNIGNAPVTIPTNTEYALYKGSVSAANKAGAVIVGTGVITLEPNQSQAYSNRATMQSPNIRAQAGAFDLIMVADATNLVQETNEANNTITLPITIGDVSIVTATTTIPSLFVAHSSSIAGPLIPGSIGAKLANFNTTTGSGDIWINSIRIERQGGTDATFHNYKLYDGTTQVGFTIAAASSIIDFNFPAIRQPANSSKVFTLYGDVINSVSYNQDIRFLLSAVYAINVATTQTITPSGPPMYIGGVLTIFAPPDPSLITILTPNGGEKLMAGGVYYIKFNAQVKGGVWVQLFKGDKYIKDITTYDSPYDVIGMKEYEWHIPSDIILGADYKIRVMKPGPSGSGYNILEYSDAPFSIVLATSTTSMLKADLKVNNSDNPAAIPYGSIFTASWASSGASYCTGYGNDIIATDGSVWGDRTKYPASGSKTLYAKSASGSVPFSVFHLGLQCWDDFGNSTTDLIENIPAAFSITGTVLIKEGSLVKTPSDPSVYVIKEGQKIKINSPKEFEEKGYKWDQIQTVQSDLLAQIAELKAQIAQLREELKKTGALLKVKGATDVYVIQEGQKVKINNPEEFNQKGYKWNQIQEVSANELSSIQTLTPEAVPAISAVSGSSGYPNGTLIKAIDGNDVYVIINGKKRRIPDPVTFNKFGYKWEQIKKVAGDELSKISDDTAVSIPAVPQAMPASLQGVGTGFLVKSIDSPTVYYITPTGMKKPIPSVEVFNSYPENRFENVKIVPQSQIDGYPKVNLFKQNSDAKVYFIEDGKKKWVKTEAAFTKHGFDFSKVSSVNKTELDAYPDGEVIE